MQKSKGKIWSLWLVWHPTWWRWVPVFSFGWVWRCPSSCWRHSIPVANNLRKTYQVCAVAEGQHGWIGTCLEIKAFWDICNSKKGLNYKLGHCLDSSGQFWGDFGLEPAANNLDYQFWVQHICFTLLSESGSDSNITMASGALHGHEIKVGTKFQGSKDTLSTRVSKSEYAKVSRRSARLQLGEEHDIHMNPNIMSKVSCTQV